MFETCLTPLNVDILHVGKIKKQFMLDTNGLSTHQNQILQQELACIVGKDMTNLS